MRNETTFQIKNRPFILLHLATGVYLVCGPMDIQGATHSQTIHATDEKSAIDEGKRWANSLLK